MNTQNLIPGQTYANLLQLQSIAKQYGFEQVNEDRLFSNTSISHGAAVEWNGEIYWFKILDQKQFFELKVKRKLIAIFVLRVPTQYETLVDLGNTLTKSLKKSITLLEAREAVNRGRKIIAVSKDTDKYNIKSLDELPERHGYHSFWI